MTTKISGDSTFPISIFTKCKNFAKNEKVKFVAKEVFKALACVACGAMLGTIACSPLGLSMLIGAGIGASFGAFIYFAVASVHFTIKAFGFPSYRHLTVPPLSQENLFTDINQKKFRKTLNEISKLDYFNAWMTHKGINLAEAEKKLWKKFQKGTCQGQSQTLITLLKKYHDYNGEDLLGEMKAKHVFKRQVLEEIRSDLKNNQEVAGLVKEIPKTEELFFKGFSRLELANDPNLLFDQLKDLKKALQDTYQSVAITIRLQNDHEAHTLFAELHPTYRFYDSYNPIYTGFYEGFKNEKRFFKALQRHIEGYQSSIRPFALKYENVIIRAYRIDHTKARENAQKANAGANPF